MSAAGQPLVMVGCGILAKEVDALVARNGWRLETRFLDSALHNYLGRLSAELDGALTAADREGRDTVVFYGCCHPRLDGLLEKHRTLRTAGQNCIVMLLGYERFMAELEKGAYFLVEDWARTWEPMITAFMGSNVEVIREIFHDSHRYILALRTPCSGDFAAEAEAAARFVDLPLRWLDVGLDELEAVLAEAVARKLGSPP